MFHTGRSTWRTTVEPSYVVIPWRGFRCFTLAGINDAVNAEPTDDVVIPWRGFRCFTQKIREEKSRMEESCNPLAGI